MANNQEEVPLTQMYTTAGLLLDYVDKKVTLTLRDSTIVVGILRSFDQFGSFVLQDAVEKIYIDNFYATRDLGVYLVRGDTVALLGEFDLQLEKECEEEFAATHEEIPFEQARSIKQQKVEELENERQKQAVTGFENGLVGSTATANPYRF